MSKIKLGNRKELFNGRFITVHGQRFENIENGKPGLWECVRRKVHGRTVAVAPITPKGEIVLVSVYRIPVQSRVIELCAGLMDKPNMTETELAVQEMREETGYKAERIVHLMTGVTNAGLEEGQMSIYLGHNAVKVGEPQLEAGEDIEVVCIPLSEVFDFLQYPPLNTLVDLKIHSVISHPRVRSLRVQ